jgi:hypothetical protein
MRTDELASFAMTELFMTSTLTKLSYAQGGKGVPFLISQDRTNQIIGSADIESLESLGIFLNLTR